MAGFKVSHSFKVSHRVLNAINTRQSNCPRLIAERLSLTVSPSTESRMEILEKTYKSIKEKPITEQLHMLHQSGPEQLSPEIANFLRKNATENKESADYVLSSLLTRFEKRTKVDNSGTNYLIDETHEGIKKGLSHNDIKKIVERALYQYTVNSGSPKELELTTLNPDDHNKFSQTDESKRPETLKKLDELLKYCRKNV